MKIEYPIVHCCSCGTEDEAHFCEPYQSNMINKKLCFNCLFWEDHIESDKNEDKTRFAVIEGKHYLMCEEKSPSLCRGFGGRPFYILFFDGRKVMSSNLWFQGKIPNLFRDRMPDNAEFITEEEFAQNEQ